MQATVRALKRIVKPRRIWYSSSASEKKLVLGCGSNVVDQVLMVKAVPKVGEKGYFRSPTRILEKSVVGGVTLNHLSWASLLGVPTGLLALQGDDASGKLVRSSMKELGVSTKFVQVSKEYTTGESYVFIQDDGERSIIMSTGATSLMDDNAMYLFFDDTIRTKGMMLTTEISQVPLSGVLHVLQTAKAAGITTVLDLDVAPSVAVNEACLGHVDTLLDCLKLADVLKPAKHAAQEVIGLLDPDIERKTSVENMSMKDITQRLQEACASKLVAVTCGKESTVLVTADKVVEVPTVPVKHVLDATGAGDAFLGGLIAGLHYNGLPVTETELRELGELANKTGSACTQVLGGLPNQTSRDRLHEEIMKFAPERLAQTGGSGRLEEFSRSLSEDADAVNAALPHLNDGSTAEFIDTLAACTGRVLTSAIGKSGIIAERMAASLASTGTPAHFVHASEWTHGDLGNARSDDVVVFISHSGNTVECVEAAHLLNQRGVRVLAIVGKPDCRLQRWTNLCLCYDKNNSLSEPHGGVPTRSIVLQEILVNAVVCELMNRREFTKLDFFTNHPGGSLGRILSSDDDAQR